MKRAATAAAAAHTEMTANVRASMHPYARTAINLIRPGVSEI